MKHAHTDALSDVPSEMAIVDTFTRLIFSDAGRYSTSELRVIAALRCVEPELSVDDRFAMGEYLRALGVAEMVRLVSRVRLYSQHMQSQTPLGSSRRRRVSAGRRTHSH